MINTDRVLSTLYEFLLTQSGWNLTECVKWLKEEMNLEPDGFVDYVSDYYPERIVSWVG